MEFNATFLVSAISFIVFVFIMNAILYKPVIKIMEEREAFLKSNFDEAEAARFETGKISDKKQSELAAARAEATSIVSDGTAKFKAENKTETDEFEKAQKSRIEEEKTVLKDEAENSKDSLNNGSSEISKIIVDKVLGV